MKLCLDELNNISTINVKLTYHAWVEEEKMEAKIVRKSTLNFVNLKERKVARNGNVVIKEFYSSKIKLPPVGLNSIITVSRGNAYPSELTWQVLVGGF